VEYGWALPGRYLFAGTKKSETIRKAVGFAVVKLFFDNRLKFGRPE
jgi:hypothetical protein